MKKRDNMSVFENIKSLLDRYGIKYETFEHEPVYTSEDAARVRGENPEIGAKSLLFIADKRPILIVLPGDRKVDTTLFKNHYSIKDLRLATSQEVLEKTSVPVGAVPPFGNLMNLDTYCDRNLLESDEIVFNAGKHTISIKMKAKDYQRLVKPVVASFTSEPNSK